MGMAMAMASVALALCLCTTVVFSTPPPAQAYTGHPSSPPSPTPATAVEPTSSAEYKTYIILLKPRADAQVMDDEARQGWYQSFLPDDVTAHGEPRLVHSYNTIFHGFAALLTEEELHAASRKPGFGRWFPDEMMYPTTTRSPEFLGLSKDAGLWPKSSYGKGVIIGVIDSGIDSHHPSFDDAGMSPPPTRWKGTCTGLVRPVRCNNKLIGLRSLVDYSPADASGHGTHVASIAAGNFVANASSSHGQATGTAAGIAPGAHVAVYKACRPSGCLRSNIIRAIDTAVSDGVDVINISLGRKPGLPLSRDVVAIGVVFVTSAGNDGPGPSTVKNDSPWEFTVAAGSVDRRLAADLVLGTGDLLVEGEALVQGPNSTAYRPLHYPGEGNLCKKVSAERTRGHIVICDDAMVDVDAQARIIKNLYDNGAAQVVLIGQEKAGFTLGFREYGSSVVQEPAAVGHKLKEYSRYPDSTAQVLFKGTRLGVRPSPTVAHFSSRGPSRGNPHIMKPDILAPGLNILAAATASPDRGPFRFKSGTSMAAPHISGVIALLKSVHPDWSPAAIRSAIMTTADDVDNEGSRIMNEKNEPASAFAVGAGHVNATRAVDPGLVYDLEVRDYAGYICHLFAKLSDDDDDNNDDGDYAVQDIIQDLNLNCKTVPPLSDVDLNYPSIVVPANTTVRRTLTNVGPAGEYTGRLSMFHDVGVHFLPESLSFSRPGEKLTFQVSHHGPEVAEGFLIWESDTHTVQSPLLVVRS